MRCRDGEVSGSLCDGRSNLQGVDGNEKVKMAEVRTDVRKMQRGGLAHTPPFLAEDKINVTFRTHG